MDAELLEQHKENVRPLAGGHAAGKLCKALGLRPAPGADAAAFEATLASLDELDDPLQAYCDYVAWTHTAFPQGNNRASGLVLLLERCTSQFRDTPHYKNDPRYVRLWMEYKEYLDAPRDVFVYLAKKGIGLELAMYYEQFGDFLEAQGDVAAAREVYERGVAVQARPARRMARSRESFERRAARRSPRRERRGLSGATGASDGGSAIGVAGGAAGGAGAFAAAPAAKRPRLTVYADDAAPASVFDAAPASLASIKLRTKENTLAAQPWAGEVLPQKPVERPAGARIEVYRDPAGGPAAAGLFAGLSACHPAGPGVVFSITMSHGVAHTLVETAKKPERLAFDLSELYTPSEEFCLGEVMARRRRGTRRRSDRLELVLDDTTRPASPTMTMFSRMANNEVLDMFNRAEPPDSAPETTETETNYDGFVTETLTKAEWGGEPAAGTPPTDHYDSGSERASSPFVERPLDPAGPFDPMDLELRERLLTLAGVASLPGAHFIALPKRNCERFAAITNPHTQVIPRGCAESIIDYCGAQLSLRFKLGRGGYGTVYLVETEQGQLRALKIEAPASRWEYYVLSQIHSRVPAPARAMFVRPRLLHCFEDESYLLMDYVSQGTVLDVLNYYKRTGKDSVDEAVAMWIALKVLCGVEALHAAGVIHADLKADNCMMRFGADSGVTLIDFGRAVDLRLFQGVASAAPPATPLAAPLAAPAAPRFVSHWRCDLQDCPQMHRGESWSHEADFYGAAAVVHTMLFGRYIEVAEQGGRYVLKASFKRYWQTPIWGPFFDAMLNGEGGVRHHRQVMEEWLASSARGLEGKLRDVEVELRENAKRVLRSL